MARWVLPVFVGPSTAVTRRARSCRGSGLEARKLELIAGSAFRAKADLICSITKRPGELRQEFRTRGERIAAESLTLPESLFVHRNISRRCAALAPCIVFEQDSTEESNPQFSTRRRTPKCLRVKLLHCTVCSVSPLIFRTKPEHTGHESDRTAIRVVSPTTSGVP